MTPTEKQGFIVCFATYLFWGLAPIYFKLFENIDAIRIIAHRIVWGLVFLLIFLLVRDGRQLIHKARLSGRQLAGLCLTGGLIALNWLVFVWAVNQDQILATSLGYFITPLIQVLLGMLFLKERINRTQTVSLIIAVSSTAYLALSMGGLPWVSLVLAFSFGFYGLFRKQLDIGPLTGLAWESLLLLPLAIGYLIWMPLPATGSSDDLLMLLFVGAGLVTVLPLIGFNYSAVRLKLSTIGFMQYMAPSISFLIAVFVYGEVFSRDYQIAFGGIWLALLVLSIGPLLSRMSRHEDQSAG